MPAARMLRPNAVTMMEGLLRLQLLKHAQNSCRGVTACLCVKIAADIVQGLRAAPRACKTNESVNHQAAANRTDSEINAIKEAARGVVRPTLHLGKSSLVNQRTAEITQGLVLVHVIQTRIPIINSR